MRSSMLNGSLVMGCLLIGCLIIVKVTKNQQSGKMSLPVVESLIPTKPLVPLTPDWKTILFYIGSNGSQDCRNLFTTANSKSIWLIPQYSKAMNELAEGMKTKPPVAISGIIKMYQEIARLDFVKTVCEIGIHDGQRTVALMSTKSSIKTHIFKTDGNEESITKMAAALNIIFPNRVMVRNGEFVTAVKAATVSTLGKEKCDIISFNGGKDTKIGKQHLITMKMIAAKKHIIIADDIYSPAVHAAWSELNVTKIITRLFDCRVPGTDIDIALGHYNG